MSGRTTLRPKRKDAFGVRRYTRLSRWIPETSAHRAAPSAPENSRTRSEPLRGGQRPPGRISYSQSPMPRHGDIAENAAFGHWKVSKTEVDGNAARLLFLEAGGIDASQGPHQRGLAMIDMPCGADNHSARS